MLVSVQLVVWTTTRLVQHVYNILNKKECFVQHYLNSFVIGELWIILHFLLKKIYCFLLLKPGTSCLKENVNRLLILSKYPVETSKLDIQQYSLRTTVEIHKAA